MRKIGMWMALAAALVCGGAEFYEFDSDNPLPEKIEPAADLFRIGTAKDYTLLCFDLSLAPTDSAVSVRFRGDATNPADAKITMVLRASKGDANLASAEAPLGSGHWRTLTLPVQPGALAKVTALVMLNKTGGTLKLELAKPVAAGKIQQLPAVSDSGKWLEFDLHNPLPELLTTRDGALVCGMKAKNYGVIYRPFAGPFAGSTVAIRLRRVSTDAGNVVLGVRPEANSANTASRYIVPEREFRDYFLTVPGLQEWKNAVIVLAFEKSSAAFEIEVSSIGIL